MTEHSVAHLVNCNHFHRFFKYDVFCACSGAGVLGAYFLFIAYLGIIGLMTNGGFGGAAIKCISEGEEQDEYFSAFVVLRSVFVTLVVVAPIVFRSYFIDLDTSGCVKSSKKPYLFEKEAILSL